MYQQKPEYSNLIGGSKHLLHSEFVRCFIASIGVLEYLGDYRPSPPEGTTSRYEPNTAKDPWRPWHHIYSMTKSGKGQKHNPQVNQLGMQI